MNRPTVFVSAAVLSLWAGVALADQAPRCSMVEVAATALDGVKQVSPGHISSGESVRLQRQPGVPCTAGEGGPNYCPQDLRPGISGVQITNYQTWVCVALPAQGKINAETVWVPSKRWVRDPESAPGSWTGVWQNQYARITVTALEGHLHLSGHAIWQGPRDPHFGEFQFDGIPTDNTIKVVSDACEIQVRRVGKFLFAQDNRQGCGGMNVTFDGLYRFRGDIAATDAASRGTAPGEAHPLP